MSEIKSPNQASYGKKVEELTRMTTELKVKMEHLAKTLETFKTQIKPFVPVPTEIYSSRIYNKKIEEV